MYAIRTRVGRAVSVEKRTTTAGESKVGAAARWVAPLCWIAVLLDGFDLVVLGAVIPSLLDYEPWGLTTASLTVISTLGLVGMTIGALAIGTLTDVVGRRKALMFSVISFSRSEEHTSELQSPKDI